ncbi:glycosyltransferase family 2 protein, partial [Patescibacteria group bacterium]|nr:glycosyltransferase family 2 protein [Patescibacteria group bacterium]
GFLDALWRKKKSLNLIEKFSTLFINEFRYIYPTYRLHISKGKIRKDDEGNLRKLENRLKEIVGEGEGSVVFCPLGLGGHVDHIMAREASLNTFPNVIFWEDAPYNLHYELDKDYIGKNNLKRKFFRKNQASRKKMYPAYKTQFGKLFKRKKFELRPEAYYMKEKSHEKKPTVTVGIPAYNEEANIEYMLRSVLAQKTDNFVLEKIIVISDASEDKTSKIVKRMSKIDKRVVLISGKMRRGMIRRMAQYFSLNKSDILFSMDADIVLGHSQVMERMVAKLTKNRNLVLVVAHHIPIKPKSFVGRVIYASYQLWDEIRLSLDNPDHIRNSWGAAIAVKRSFSENINFLKNLTGDQEFMYIKSKEFGDFAYLLDAPVYYRPAGTVKEMFSMSRTRSVSKDQDILVEAFGERINELYNIPAWIKIKAIVKRLVKSPVLTPLALSINIIWRLIPSSDEVSEIGLWEIAESTKKAIKEIRIGSESLKL